MQNSGKEIIAHMVCESYSEFHTHRDIVSKYNGLEGNEIHIMMKETCLSTGNILIPKLPLCEGFLWRKAANSWVRPVG
jgi:hypothetical protein